MCNVVHICLENQKHAKICILFKNSKKKWYVDLKINEITKSYKLYFGIYSANISKKKLIHSINEMKWNVSQMSNKIKIINSPKENAVKRNFYCIILKQIPWK